MQTRSTSRSAGFVDLKLFESIAFIGFASLTSDECHSTVRDNLSHRGLNLPRHLAQVLRFGVSEVVGELQEDVEQLFFAVFDSEHDPELREHRLDAVVHELIDSPVYAIRDVDEQRRARHHIIQNRRKQGFQDSPVVSLDQLHEFLRSLLRALVRWGLLGFA